MASGGVLSNGSWHSIPQYAGGTPNAGSVFVAGEAGAEVVGHINGRTEVLNRSQMASVMYSAITRGMASVMNATKMTLYSKQAANATPTGADPEYDNIWMDSMARKVAAQINSNNVGSAGDQEIVVMLDSDVLFRSTVKANRRNMIRTGENALMGGYT